jgi:hypothetical protein
MNKVALILAVIACVAAFGTYRMMGEATQARTAENVAQVAQSQAEIATLKDQIKKLEGKFDGLVPDQAAIMTHVGYHFTNLWFAVDQENWPLADFYLGEARNNIKWAVRSKPFRKGPNGETVDLNAIATALDTTQMAGLKKAIDAKQKAQFVTLYAETQSQCYGCHKASGKPYLRPQVPASPEVRIINMDPKATTPQ